MPTPPNAKTNPVPQKSSAEEAAKEEEIRLQKEKDLRIVREDVDSLRNMVRQLQAMTNGKPNRNAENAVSNIRTMMLDYLLVEHDLLEEL